MRVTYGGPHSQMTDRDLEQAEKKLQRLSRYFRSAREARITHAVQRNQHIVEVQVDLDGAYVRAEDRSPDFNASLDAVVDKLENQVRRFKSRVKQHKGRADAPTVASVLAELPEEEAEPEEPAPTIARRKRFAIKPMTVDEAALQIDLLNHDFFVFANSDTGQVNVLYRRRAGDLGLLEIEG